MLMLYGVALGPMMVAGGGILGGGGGWLVVVCLEGTLVDGELCEFRGGGGWVMMA